MTENELLEGILDTAKALRWRVAHFRPAKTAKGWRTPVSADGQGFPDLVMLRQGRMVVAELKAAHGRFGPGQEEWLDDFQMVANTIDVANARAHAPLEVYVWTPREWASGAIEKILR